MEAVSEVGSFGSYEQLFGSFFWLSEDGIRAATR